MSHQSVGVRIIVVPAIAALALGMSGCGSPKKTAERAGASASASVASKASRAASKIASAGASAGARASSKAAAAAAATPTTTVVAQKVKAGAFCSIHYQKGVTANGKAVTCKKAKDGKWRWL
jgi:hypothetical protein